ncbi:MAG: hypothetical protein QOE90_3598 [Thermoplasmata archaeon]|jgi:hypothetical protein|nr:hypothetical protein [Thermoplasmata archaeon]
MRALPLLLVLALLAGCLGAAPAAQQQPPAAPVGSLKDLTATAAKTTLDNADGTRTFQYEGQTQGGASAILLTQGVKDPLLEDAFKVDDRVGFVEVNVTLDASQGNSVIAELIDEAGKVQCSALSFMANPTCTVPVPSNLTTPVSWKVRVNTGYPTSAAPAETPGQAFKLAVTLHLPSQVTRGDPLAGTDSAISFRVSDTKLGGGEDNVGVLPDGSVWTQVNTATLKSTDDGATWKDVGPATTSQVTLDPMMYVDDARNTVYVDQLYVGCSALAWSADAGASWTSNPAACGGPGDDHQKLGVGPNPTPAPFPAVYYSYSSFAKGVWVSRSLDGGVSFTTAPVVGVSDSRTYANDGPVIADEKGDVYVPLYMCDNGGYMGVGVSNDYGMTFSFVEVDKTKEACSDVDPGLAVDAAGVAYLAYHRADGIRYSFSKDHGKTWSAPVTVSPPTQRSFVHVDAVAGDAGKLAIVYRATSDTAKGPDGADGWAGWYLYTAFVENATDDGTRSVKVGMVTPPEDIQQRGPMCTAGVACDSARNLLDFIDIAVGPDGRVYISYSDGCKDPCPMPADSRRAEGMVAIEGAGPKLWEKAPWAKVKSNPTSVPNVPGTQADRLP